MKKIMLLGVILSILLSACSQKPKPSKLENKLNSENPTQEKTSMPDEQDGEVKDLGDYMVETIDAQNETDYLLYDPSKGRLMCISEDNTDTGNATASSVNYSLKRLNEKNEWVEEMNWSTQNEAMNMFTYSIKGDLYAIGYTSNQEVKKEKDHQKEKKGEETIRTNQEHCLYKIQEGGRLKKITLKNLNKTIVTEFDKEQKEKALKEHKEDKITDMPLETWIAGMNVLKDGTVAIQYGNATLKIYDLTEGTVMQTIAMENPSGYNDSSFIVAQDEIIAGSYMNILSNDTIDVLDKDTGEWKREFKIEGKSSFNEIESSGQEEETNYDARPSLSLGTMNDLYLFRVNDGIYGGSMDESDLEMIVDSSVLDLKPEYLYRGLIRGINDDFYIIYYNRATQKIEAIHCFPNK